MSFRVVLAAFLSLNLAHAAPTRERIQQIREVVSNLTLPELLTGLEVKTNDRLPGPAWSYAISPTSFVIEYNPAYFLPFNRSGRDFIMFHELGHIRLGHVLLAYPGPEAAREYELEADVFGTYAWEKFQRGTREELEQFFAFIEDKPTIPPGAERVQLCKSLMSHAP